MQSSLIQFFYQSSPVFILLLILSCASTKTYQEQYAESLPLVRSGAYKQAADIIEEAKDDLYKEKDRVLYYLDLGMLLHWAGEYETSNTLLTKAEEAIEELFTKSISKGLSSAVLNDNALDYSGEDYEDIYLNLFKCLNYIAMEDNESAQVEIRRVQIKLNRLENKYKELVAEYNTSDDTGGQIEIQENRFHNDVLARYLSALLYRADGATDDARIDIEAINEAWLTQSHLYDFEKPPLPAVEEPDDGKVLVNILSFSGLSPAKLADTLVLDSGAGVVFATMEDHNEDYVKNNVGFSALSIPSVTGGVHFKIQFPRLAKRQSAADRIIVKFDGTTMAELPMLEKMDLIAQETFRQKLPLTIGRTIIRATLKQITKEIGKSALDESLGNQGVGGALLSSLAGIVADVAVDATENADLRISQFFPSSTKAIEIAVEPGAYSITVEYWDGNSLLGTTDHGIRECVPGQLNLVESYMLR